MNFTPKTWKELYNYYHPDGKVSTKYLRTLFSKAKGNRWDVVCTPNYIDIKCIKGKLTLSGKLPPTAFNIKRVDYIRLNTVTFENGFTTNWDKGKMFNYYQTENGKYNSCRFNADESYRWNILQDINITAIGTTHGYLLSSDMLRDADAKGACVSIDSKYLFLEDYFLAKKGDIIKWNSYGYSRFQSPLQALSGQLVSILGFPECNLTLNTVEEIQKKALQLVDNVGSCRKQAFGCSRGCTHSCWSEGDKGLIKRHAQWMISLKQKYKL